MENNNKKYVDMLIGLEPVFKKAGALALEMRKTAISKNKFNTGIAGIDIVTNADLAVQKFVLKEMAKTKLVECRLVAEEDTPETAKFKGTNKLVLTLDPIDGTFIYATTGRFYSIIVGLNDGKKIIYTFYYYPQVDWALRIVGDKISGFDKNLPEVIVKEGMDLSHTIMHTSGNPKEGMPEIYSEMIKKGYDFKKLSEVTSDSTSSVLFFLGKTGGYYTENPNLYDGFGVLHYGQAKKLKIYSEMDISKTKIGDHGVYYPGWYLVLQK